jgi:hypothetical protein
MALQDARGSAPTAKGDLVEYRGKNLLPCVDHGIPCLTHLPIGRV